MAFTDRSPAAWLGAGYDTATGKISLNTASSTGAVTLPQLSDAEANKTSGDIRKLLFALFDGLYESFNAKNSALATDARPGKITFSRTATANPDGSTSRTYVFSATLAAPSVIEVADET